MRSSGSADPTFIIKMPVLEVYYQNTHCILPSEGYYMVLGAKNQLSSRRYVNLQKAQIVSLPLLSDAYLTV